MNPQWNMCSRGKRQSPVNVDPEKLLFDPHLRQIHINKEKVSFRFVPSKPLLHSRNYSMLEFFPSKKTVSNATIYNFANQSPKFIRNRIYECIN